MHNLIYSCRLLHQTLRSWKPENYIYSCRSDKIRRLKKRRAMRLRNRNLRKEKAKLRSEYTKEEREAESHIIAKNHALCLEVCKRKLLEKSERIAKEEKEPWPPVSWKPIKESILYKCGVIAPFVDKRWDFEDMDDSEFDSKPKYAALRNKHGNDVLNKLKIFLAQVRDGRGFDVDWHPPPFIRSPFTPRDVHIGMKECPYFFKSINKMLECTVQRINARAKNHGEEYKLLDVERVVECWRHAMTLITFSVELIKDGGVEVVKDVQVLIRFEGRKNYDCVEWRFKPCEDGPSTHWEGPILESLPAATAKDICTCSCGRHGVFVPRK